MKHHLELLLVSVLVSFNISLAQNYGGWQQVDSMKEARYSYPAIQLADGRVLIVGGVGASDSKSCEFYDPLLNKWSAAPKTNYVRSRHRLIMLNSGRVLAVGSPRTKTCEIFDPALNKWIVTDSLKVGRVLAKHEVIRLLDDRVLVTGGYTYDYPFTDTGTLNLCEIFDESIEKWSIADSMKTRRSYHSATLLKDGRVLVAGGTSSVDPLSSCEIYDPSQNKWSDAAPLNVARESHSALLLPSGKVLVVAGYSYNNLFPTRSCELYDPIQDKWEIVDSTQVEGSAGAAFILDERNILLVGANGNQNLIWEIYDYINFRSKYVGYVNTSSFSNNKIQLSDGRVLVSGGVTTPDYFHYLPVKRCWMYDKNITHVDEGSDQMYSNILFQNYPNPFNPSTKISFTIPQKENVKLRVFDVLGRAVSILADGVYESGKYEVNFDAGNLPSGVYFYNLTTSSNSISKKMLLVK